MSNTINSGIFITFEGGEGSGKSTQVKLLHKYLLENNYPVVVTREPGGTQIGEQLRTILLQGNVNKMNAITEALIFLAARANNWEQIIKPALDDNKIVICDRFQDSTLVYQGICNNIDINLLNEIYKQITNNIFPTRTYLINIDPTIGLKRSIRSDNAEVRFENKALEYHKKIQEAYLKIAKYNNAVLNNYNIKKDSDSNTEYHDNKILHSKSKMENSSNKTAMHMDITNKLTHNKNRYLIIDGNLSINEINNIIINDIRKIINDIK